MSPRFLWLGVLVVSVWACTPDEEVFSELSDERLYFSTDTLFFDTLLTTQPSPSYRVQLFNPNKNGVIVPSISLASLNDSPYELTINGLSGKSFSNVKILGGDSLLILVKATLPPTGSASPELSRDYIEIAGNTEKIVIDAWAQDATFLSGLNAIVGNIVWDSPLPYVISDTLLVTADASLTILEGVEVVMRPGSGFFVAGSLLTEGSQENKVVFRNDRSDRGYKEAPGQWEGIFFLEGSKGNFLDHTVIKNANIGLYIGTPDDDDTPDVTLSNCLIANMSSDGILAFTSDVYAYNTVIYNVGRYLLGNLAGGNYRYEHCTFTNYPSDFFRDGPAVVFSDNILLDDLTLLTAPLQASVFNSIIWGSEQEEIELNTEGGSSFLVQIGYSVLKTKRAIFDVNNNILNTNPKFYNEFLYDYRPDSLSPLINAANYLNIDLDIQGLPRDSLPDIGAYEWTQGQKNQ